MLHFLYDTIDYNDPIIPCLVLCTHPLTKMVVYSETIRHFIGPRGLIVMCSISFRCLLVLLYFPIASNSSTCCLELT